jgi:N-methylhydantoinase B/oxoprolinase/acetone carboxylase alpha subunit
MMVRKGDVVRLETSGGGGFGNPREREPALIERDLRYGYVSADAAAGVYGHSSAT